MTGSLRGYAVWQRLVDGLAKGHRRAMSEADRGYDAAAHYAAIEAIIATGVVPTPLEWVPREVLQLTMWSYDPIQRGDGALMVLFASVVVATAEVLLPGYGPSASRTATVLLRVATCLGGSWMDDVLVWSRDLAAAAYEQERASGWCDNEPVALALAGLILASRAERPPAERGWWRARIDEARTAWEDLHHRSVWTVFDSEWQWWVWEDLMAPVHRDVVGFRPPSAAGRKQG